MGMEEKLPDKNGDVEQCNNIAFNLTKKRQTSSRSNHTPLLRGL
jgi:hypothetical protein